MPSLKVLHQRSCCSLFAVDNTDEFPSLSALLYWLSDRLESPSGSIFKFRVMVSWAVGEDLQIYDSGDRPARTSYWWGQQWAQVVSAACQQPPAGAVVLMVTVQLVHQQFCSHPL